jgi:hypothetical protein
MDNADVAQRGFIINRRFEGTCCPIFRVHTDELQSACVQCHTNCSRFVLLSRPRMSVPKVTRCLAVSNWFPLLSSLRTSHVTVT